MPKNFDLSNATKAKVPSLAFFRIKEAVLGVNYSLSVAVVGAAEMRRLNRSWRGKDKATDILSFPLSKSEGEIYLCPSEAKKEAKKFGQSTDDFLRFLFIHGLVHLKGYDHGAIMERIEARFHKKFGI